MNWTNKKFKRLIFALTDYSFILQVLINLKIIHEMYAIECREYKREASTEDNSIKIRDKNVMYANVIHKKYSTTYEKKSSIL